MSIQFLDLAAPRGIDGVNVRPLPQFSCGSALVMVRRHVEGHHVICVTGPILRDAAAGLAELIVGELTHQPASLTLDLSGVTVVDAAGGQLLELATLWAADRAVPLRYVPEE